MSITLIKAIMGTVSLIATALTLLAQRYPENPILGIFVITLSPKKEDYDIESAYYFAYWKQCTLWGFLLMLYVITVNVIAYAPEQSSEFPMILMGASFIGVILFMMSSVAGTTFLFKGTILKVLKK